MSIWPSRGPVAAAALALGVAVAGVAAAQVAIDTPATAEPAGTESPGDRSQRVFSRIDLDDSGSLSQEEIEAWRLSAVFRLDGDADGRVTKQEVDQHMAQRQAEGKPTQDSAAFFQAYDADFDGAVDQDELRTAGFRRFQIADTDADGELSMEEWQALHGS